MDVRINMWIGKGSYAYEIDFDVLAIEPGNFSNFTRDKYYWKEKDNDESVLKIAHVMERALKLDYLTVYKESDRFSAMLLEHFTKHSTLIAKMDIAVGYSLNDQWKGTYNFQFKIKQFRHNQESKSGKAIDYAVLKIRDRSEKIDMPGDVD